MTDAIAPTLPLGPFALGETVAQRYRVDALLGEGAMGMVYRAHDLELDESVALKVLRPEAASDADALRRFRREVKLARRVLHPNVARAYDIGSSKGHHFFTMELIAGGSLGDRMRTPIPLPELLRVAAEVARGLAAAHAVGVIHRDLKPDNVMLDDARVAITDFGIACAAEARSDILATSGAIVGTPAYMAPEQLEHGAVDGRADVYALGVMIFEMVSGELPFTGPSPIAVAAARMLRPAPSLLSVAPSTPSGLVALVSAALARQREDRPDASAVAREVDRLRGISPHLVTTPVAPTRTPSDTSPALVGVFLPTLDAPAELVPLAEDLCRAVRDGLVAERIPAADSIERATHVVCGELRASKDQVRLRLRINAAGGAPVWAERFDAAVGETFELEDRAVEGVMGALRSRNRKEGDLEGPALDRLKAAIADFERFDLQHVLQAQNELEALVAENPRSPSAMAALAEVLLRSWSQTGALGNQVPARAEALALQSLAIEALPQAYFVLALLRVQTGRYSEAWRSLEETLRRAPMLVGALHLQGILLGDTGHVNAALSQLELVLRRAPKHAVTHNERVSYLALTGDGERAKRALAQADEAVGPAAMTVVRARLPFLLEDRPLAGEIATMFERVRSGAAWEQSLPYLRAYTRDEPLPAGGERVFERLVGSTVAARYQCIIHAVAAEMYCAFGHHDLALEHVERQNQAGTINLLWFDHCRPLAALRSNQRWLQIRGEVAGRAASVIS